MRKVILWISLAVSILLLSLIIRINKYPVLYGFKHKGIQLSETNKRQFYLYFCFSIKDCNSCLDTIDIIKKYSNIFKIIGVLPESELKEIDLLRREYGIDFDIISERNILKYKPAYSPSMIGVSDSGKIYFVMPIVIGYYEYVEIFLIKFLERYNLIGN